MNRDPREHSESPAVVSERSSSRRRSWIFLAWIFGAVGLVILALVIGRSRPLTWAMIEKRLHERYPDVEHITVEELASRLAEATSPPVLLDVRELAEYEVSHLPGALHVTPSAQVLPQDLPLDTPIVAYCSVGQRSAEMVRRLEALGYRQVVNLEGSIFAWANAGHPLERAGEPVREVHPYDAFWGSLLRPELRADLPEE